MSTWKRPCGGPLALRRRNLLIGRPRRRRRRPLWPPSSRCRLVKRRRRHLVAPPGLPSCAPRAGVVSVRRVERQSPFLSVGRVMGGVFCRPTPSWTTHRACAASKVCFTTVPKLTTWIAPAQTIPAVADQTEEQHDGACWPRWPAYYHVCGCIGLCAEPSEQLSCATNGTRDRAAAVALPSSRPGRPPSDCWGTTLYKTFNLLRILVYIELPPHFLRSPVLSSPAPSSGARVSLECA